MLKTPIKNTTEYKRLLAAVKEKGASAVFGLPPAGRAQIAAALCADTARPLLIITSGEAEATRIAADAETFGISTAVYPTRDYVFRNIEAQSHEYEYRRLDVLGKLAGGRVQLVAAPIEAVLQRTMPLDFFINATQTITAGKDLPQKELVNSLFAAGYIRRPQIDGPGQFSVRGAIVDIYAPDMPLPARLEYWGNTIDEINAFSLLSQRSEGKLEKFYLSPARESVFGSPEETIAFLQNALNSKKGSGKNALQKIIEHDIQLLDAGIVPGGMDKYLPLLYTETATILDHMPNAIVWMDEPSALKEEAAAVTMRTEEEQKHLLEEGVFAPAMQGYHIQYPQVLGTAQHKSSVFAENFSRAIPDVSFKENIKFSCNALPPWRGDLQSLTEELRPLVGMGYFCAVLCGTSRAMLALARDLENEGFSVTSGSTSHIPGTVAVLSGMLSGGLEFTAARFALFTSRRHAQAKKKSKKAKNKSLANIADINAGDYVVHQTHGVGQYTGIQRMEVHGATKDYLKITYAKGDSLYVPVTQLDALSRYTAPGESDNVKLSKLGGTDWVKTKNRVRAATQEMAKELIELYAKREHAKGYAFPSDDDWQRDFETRFEYDETPSQLSSAEEIKADMQQPRPMDRLLCGDVGVGKTEVALRAAFKCIMGGKQCAILVPTTLLAWQHYNTILTRMEAFPAKVGLLNRFRTAKQQKLTLQGMRNGTVDIVVGTHRLLQKDIFFKDLGLVIVDEEQRFGVKHKERLKEKFIGVDMLTLSATPIPRTLSMALNGIRDMSTIDEPPTERQPIETYVMEHDDNIIASAIKKEMGRGGQVYYLHNRIDSIEYTAARIAKMVPGSRVATAHGRMSEDELSPVWQQLLDGEIDVLVCTTLIETGVDVRNCNTLIIEDSDRMGLAQLYQIRGRVGRSGRKAYAYLTFRRDKVLTDIAAKRLSAVREFTTFGSGFRIAMRDLQIRGAGSVLGQSQSGHMHAVGYDLYVKMLNRAIATEKGEAAPPDKAETFIDIQVDAYIPEKYITDAAGRIEAYKKIAAVQTPEDADDVMDELKDRYGEIPHSVKSLVDISLLRVVASGLNIYDVIQQKDVIKIYSDKLDLVSSRVVLKKVLANAVSMDAGTKPFVGIRLAQNDKAIDVLRIAIDTIYAAVQETKKAFDEAVSDIN